jgi:hypothetical protein
MRAIFTLEKDELGNQEEHYKLSHDMDGRKWEIPKSFGGENVTEQDHLEQRCVDGTTYSRLDQSVQYLPTDWTTVVLSPTKAEEFSSHFCVQTSSGAHPASYIWILRALSLGMKRGQGVMLTTHPFLMLRLRKSRCYTSSHPKRLHGIYRDHFCMG